MNKLYNFILSLILSLWSITSIAQVVDASKTPFEFEQLSESTVELTAISCENCSSINIPSKVKMNGKTYTVTKIGNIAFVGNTDIKSVTIPSTITEIGMGAFSGCVEIKEINIPDGVNAIGDDAFSGCTNLERIYIPSSLSSIGFRAFVSCEKISFNLSPDNPYFSIIDGIIYNKAQTAVVCVPKGIKGNVVIPNGVKKISEGAFAGCIELESVAIPASISKIEDLAFAVCPKLTNVMIAYGVKEIGEGAFSYGGLKKIVIPSSVTKIGKNTFAETALTEVELPSSINRIAESTFSLCPLLEKVTIPSSIKYIGTSAFYKCQKLANLTLPSSVVAIDKWAFADCINLNLRIEKPISNLRLGDDVFKNCKSVESSEGSTQNIQRTFWGLEFGVSNKTDIIKMLRQKGLSYEIEADTDELSIPNGESIDVLSEYVNLDDIRFDGETWWSATFKIDANGKFCYITFRKYFENRHDEMMRFYSSLRSMLIDRYNVSGGDFMWFERKAFGVQDSKTLCFISRDEEKGHESVMIHYGALSK